MMSQNDHADLAEYTTPKVLLGLIGLNIMKSLSPALHQEEGKHHHLRVFYQLMDFANMATQRRPRVGDNQDLPHLIQAAAEMGFAGLNITYPCKQAVIQELDELSPEADAVAAVNTIVFQNGKRVGYNTDYFGYRQSLQDKLKDHAVGRVVLVGTGGAGAAVAHGVMSLGATHITLVDTDAQKAHTLASALAATYGNQKIELANTAQYALKHANGLINATPLGMAGIGGMCVEPHWIEARHWVSDVVYSPLVTPMLAVAQQKGCITIDGGGMNLLQAVKAFELFTGKTANVARMAHYQQQLLKFRQL